MIDIEYWHHLLQPTMLRTYHIAPTNGHTHHLRCRSFWSSGTLGGRHYCGCTSLLHRSFGRSQIRSRKRCSLCTNRRCCSSPTLPVIQSARRPRCSMLCPTEDDRNRHSNSYHRNLLVTLGTPVGESVVACGRRTRMHRMLASVAMVPFPIFAHRNNKPAQLIRIPAMCTILIEIAQYMRSIPEVVVLQSSTSFQ